MHLLKNTFFLPFKKQVFYCKDCSNAHLLLSVVLGVDARLDASRHLVLVLLGCAAAASSPTHPPCRVRLCISSAPARAPSALLLLSTKNESQSRLIEDIEKQYRATQSPPENFDQILNEYIASVV